MARVLAISSQVVRGHVGNSAALPALQRLGHEIWPLPTIVLSNHPGHPHMASQRISPEQLRSMLGALEHNGWLGEVDAVLSGYLPSAAHVEIAVEAIGTVRRLRGAPPLLLCDPVLGDEPKGLYIEAAAAAAIRDRLLPLADVATPNRFELGWLAGEPVAGLADPAMAARRLGVATVAVTSAGQSATEITNLLVTSTAAWTCTVPREAKAPNGTGDLLAALLLGHLLDGTDAPVAFARAVAGVAAVLAASRDRDELRLTGGDWERAEAAPPLPLPMPAGSGGLSQTCLRHG